MRRGLLLGALLLSGCTVICQLKPHHHRHQEAVPLSEFQQLPTRIGNRDSVAYFRGDGPPVLLLHELPGPTPETLDLARRLSDAGFTVYVPVLFGTPNARESGFTLLKRCFSRDYNCVANHPSRAATDLLPLLDIIHGRHRDKGVGVIGMCLTGNFPLLFAQKRDYVHAIVMTQPSLPLAIGPLVRRVGMPLDELRTIATPAYTTGFDKDCISPPARRVAIKAALPHVMGNDVIATDKKQHAVLTDSLDQTGALAQFNAVVNFLHEHLDRSGG